MTDDPAGPVIDPPGSSRAEQPPPYQWIVADPGLTVQACLVATSSAASTSAVKRTRPIRAKTVRIVCACSSGLRAAMASSTNTCS